MISATILIVDDDREIRESLKEILEEDGHVTFLSANCTDARHEVQSKNIDLAIVDIKIGEENGLDLLRQLKIDKPVLPVIIISGHGTIALTAKAFRLGAHDFMEKPLRLVSVRTCIRNVLEAITLRTRVAATGRAGIPQPVYASPSMVQLFAQVDKLANITESVVILGPSGSGKELVARGLHYNGTRAYAPFVATNAASLPVNLAEDELFGHEKGAFTGATNSRIGCIEQADGGTLFLDEIADMDPQVQAKLLRVLETGTFTRLGGTKNVQVNVRFIAATHKNLEELCTTGQFRHDLWYRLCAFVLRVASLAERKEDIPLLAAHFLKVTCVDMAISREFSTEAIAELSRYAYPGNVRELKHIVTRAAVFSDSSIIEASIIKALLMPETSQSTTQGVTYTHLDARGAKDAFERDYFSAILKKNAGNITAAAAAIGMAQSNLSRKLKELGIR